MINSNACSAKKHPKDFPLHVHGITPLNSKPTHQMPFCYVLVERPARLELCGYDSVVWHVVLEASASDTR